MPPDALPPPPPGLPVPERVRALARVLGVEAVVEVCADLLGGAAREDHLDVLPYLTNQAWEEGSAVRDPASWQDYWLRHWGARGLLHVWHDAATPAVLAGLGDEHWRPAETCLRVAARHEVAGTGDRAAALAGHDLPRVRVQAARALAVVGDVEHLGSVLALEKDPESVVRRAGGRAAEAMRRRLDLPTGVRRRSS